MTFYKLTFQKKRKIVQEQSFKLEIIHFCRHPASFKIGISKVQDFGNLELSPMQDQDRQSGSKLFAKVISRQHKSLLAKKNRLT